MKKLLLIATAIAGFCALGQVAEARPHYPRSREVYIIEHGRPVFRRVYFDAYDRCYTYYGPRRVFISEYYDDYPRYYRPRPYYYAPPAPAYPVYPAPGVSFSFGFRG